METKEVDIGLDGIDLGNDPDEEPNDDLLSNLTHQKALNTHCSGPIRVTRLLANPEVNLMNLGTTFH